MVTTTSNPAGLSKEERRAIATYERSLAEFTRQAARTVELFTLVKTRIPSMAETVDARLAELREKIDRELAA